MLLPLPAPTPAWFMLTRLGEAQIMLPAAAAVVAWLMLRPGARSLVGWWVGLTAVAVAITTVTKIAFIGYGVGVAELNFTGISGHTMFASVVYPMLFRILASDGSVRWQRAALGAGIALALLVGYSRLVVHAHSPSEVLAGWAVGGLACAIALTLARVPALRPPVWLPLVVLLVLPGLVRAAPPSHSHDIVTKLSLALSGRPVPYTRAQMLRDARIARLQRSLAER